MSVVRSGLWIQAILGCLLVSGSVSPGHGQSTQGLGGLFTQAPVDCSDEAEADNPGCDQGTRPTGSDAARQQVPSGATQPAPYSDTQRLYVDQSAGSFARGAVAARRVPGRKEPLTEFQKLVAASTEAVLPVYGASLFRDAQPSTFAPVDQVQVTPEYTIGPGDEVLIRVWGQLALNARLTVDRGGAIYVPHVGQVQVAGLPYAQLESVLRSQIGRLYRNFDLNANLGQLRSIQVLVVGQARRPGSYTISSLSTLVNAVFASGGPASEGSMRNIQLKRGGQIVTTFDLYDLLLAGDKSHDSVLQSGDIVFFPPVGPQVAVAGSVRQPAIYELKPGTGEARVRDVLALAGGVSQLASTQSASIERIADRQAREELNIRLEGAGLETPLHGGDLLRVLSLVPRFNKTVTLRGNVANPGRYEWHPGMRVRDLIPNQDALLTREYWRRTNAKGAFVPDVYSPLDKPAGAGGELPQYRRRTTVSGSGGQSDQGLRQQDATQQQGGAGDERPGDTEAASRDGADAARYAGGEGGRYGAGEPLYPEDQSGDIADGGRSQAPRDSVRAEASNSPVAGSVSSGRGNFPQRNFIERSAADVDWAFAAIERLNPNDLTTNVVSFNLGAVVLRGDAEQDLPLEPGDVVTVFSKADISVPQEQQVKFVRLEGEFRAAGVYQALPGETLRALVRRVGGVTPNAYLYGSLFTRESTRQQQQQRLDEFASSLERQIEVEGSSRAASVVSASEAALSGNSLESQRSLVASVKRLRATGRVVLRIPFDAAEVSILPDLPLEDGDSFTVPARPQVVSVVGAVYNQNSFLFAPNRLLSDYLSEAGGVNRDGDHRHAFVIRADGSVVSRSGSADTIWDVHFNRTAMHPGDTLVVPDNINKRTLLRGLTDWSQVFGQFALGAAAINVVR